MGLTTEGGSGQSTVDYGGDRLLPRSLEELLVCRAACACRLQTLDGWRTVGAQAAEGFLPQEKVTGGCHCLSRFGAFTLVRENKT